MKNELRINGTTYRKVNESLTSKPSREKVIYTLPINDENDNELIEAIRNGNNLYRAIYYDIYKNQDNWDSSDAKELLTLVKRILRLTEELSDMSLSF